MLYNVILPEYDVIAVTSSIHVHRDLSHNCHYPLTMHYLVLIKHFNLVSRTENNEVMLQVMGTYMVAMA